MDYVCDGCKSRVFNPTTFGNFLKLEPEDPELEVIDQCVFFDVCTSDLVSPSSLNCSFCVLIRQIMENEISLDADYRALWENGVNLRVWLGLYEEDAETVCSSDPLKTWYSVQSGGTSLQLLHNLWYKTPCT